MTKTPLTRTQIEHQLKLVEILDSHLRTMEIHLKGVQGARFRKTLTTRTAGQRLVVTRLRWYWQDRLHILDHPGGTDAPAPSGS